MAGKIKVPSELVPSQSNKIMLRSKYVHDDVKGHDQEYINNYLEEKIDSKVIEAGGVNWDTVPTAGSNNAVKSKDIKAALEKVTGYFVLDSNIIETTVNKTVTVADFPALAIGGSIKIKMLTKNTATNPTLRIGPANATAYPLYYNEERASANNSWEANEIISVFFDGTAYRASNSQGGSNKKLDAYLYGDLKTLAVGEVYEKGEAVKTSNKEFGKIVNDITIINLKEEIREGDLRVVYKNATYQAQANVSAYTNNPTTPYVDGSYAIGSPSGATIEIETSASTSSLTEPASILLNIVGVEFAINVDSTSTPESIAQDIVSEFGTNDEWSLLDNEDGTITLISKTASNVTPTVTATVGDSGVTITPTAYTGSLNVSKFDGSVWTAFTDVATYAASDLWEAKDINWLNDMSNGAISQDTAYNVLYRNNTILTKEIPINIYRILDYSISNDGKWSSNSTKAKNQHIYVPVTAGTIYRLVPNDLHNLAYAWLTSAPGGSQGVAAPLVAGTSVKYSFVDVEEVAPPTAQYLYLRVSWDSETVRYLPKYLGTVEYVKDIVESLIDDNTILTEIDIKSLTTLNCAISTSTGNWTAATSVTQNRHVLIPTTPGTVYKLVPNSLGHADYGWLSSDVIDPGNAAPLPYRSKVNSISEERTIIAPKGAVYLYLRTNWSSTTANYPSLWEYKSVKNIVEETQTKVETLDKKVIQTIKPYVNTAAWGNGSNYSVTQSSTTAVTGGFVYKIRSKNCKITITANSNNSAYYLLLKSFTEPSDGASADIATGGSRKEIAAGAFKTIDIPDDCNYIYIGMYNTGGNAYAPKEVSFQYDIADWINSSFEDNEYKSPYYYKGNKLELSKFNLEPKKYYTTRTVHVPGIGYYGNGTSNIAQQSLAIYGGYIFLFYHAGYCKVLDIDTFEILYSFQLDSAISHSNNHCGNACFSEQFFAEDDEFPLLYISNHLQNGECYVCRIRRNSSGGFSTESITLVQMIKSALEQTDNREYHFYPHKDKLICHSGTRYNIYPLPPVNTEEVETFYLNTEDISATFNTPISGHTAAGQEARNGRIFCLWYRAAGSVPRYDLLTIYNFETGEYDAQIYLPNRLAALETEGVDVCNGKIYIGYNTNDQIGIIDLNDKGAAPVLPSSKGSSGSGNVVTSLLDKNIQRVGNNVFNIIGDSVSNPSRSEYSLSTVWWGVMKDLLGFTVGTYNCISGTPVGGSGSDAFHNRVKSLTLNGGITIIAGGMNDLGADNVPLGTFNYASSLASQIEADATLTNSFIPAYRETIEWILTHNKNTRLYLCTITPRAIKKTGMTDAQLFFPWTNPTTHNNWVEFNDAIRKLAHDYGLGLIDFANIGMYQQNGFNDESGTLPADNIWTTDGVHPNVTYQKKMGELAANVIANTMF